MQAINEEELNIFYGSAKKSLIDFAIAMDRDYDPGWFHEELAKKLEAVERGEIKRLLIEAPPRHGKSQLSSIFLPAWYLGLHPSREVIAAAYNQELALDFGGKTRDVVLSEEYRHIFNRIKLKEDTTAKGKWATEQGGMYTSVGVGGSLTGRGADLLIIEDPYRNRQDADSEVYRKNLWDWYSSTARTRLEKNGAIIVIHTRWHLFDLIGTLKEAEKGGGEHWECVSFPARALHDEPHRKMGEPLWPEKYDDQALKDLQSSMDARDWLALFQQTPIASNAADFSSSMFKQYNEDDLMHKTIENYIGVDLAISKGKEADSTSICVIGKDRNGHNIYIRERITGKMDPLQTIDAIFMLVERYNPVRVGVETVQYQEALKYFIEEEQRRRQTYFCVEGVKHGTTAKEARIRKLVPMYRTGIIHHRKMDKDLEEQLLVFPQGKHDDEIDALEIAVSMLNPTEVKQQMFRKEMSFAGNVTTY